MLVFQLGEMLFALSSVNVDNCKAVRGAGEADVVVAVCPPTANSGFIKGGKGLVVWTGFEGRTLFSFLQGNEEKSVRSCVIDCGSVKRGQRSPANRVGEATFGYLSHNLQLVRRGPEQPVVQ
jgi:hypothetical protein